MIEIIQHDLDIVDTLISKDPDHMIFMAHKTNQFIVSICRNNAILKLLYPGESFTLYSIEDVIKTRIDQSHPWVHDLESLALMLDSQIKIPHELGSCDVCNKAIFARSDYLRYKRLNAQSHL